MDDYPRCAFCKKRDSDMHVDEYHRFTPLCEECYYDPVRAKATASNPDDPKSWWNRARY
jgi:hypothetical protein